MEEFPLHLRHLRMEGGARSQQLERRHEAIIVLENYCLSPQGDNKGLE